MVHHTTASADLARELEMAADARSVGFVDAPVSGGQGGAESGQLTVMCGGRAEAFERVAPVIDCYAKSVRLMGETGRWVVRASDGTREKNERLERP